MKAKEILEMLLSGSSLKMECFECGITEEDIKNAIEEIEHDKEKLNEYSWGDNPEGMNR